MTTDAAFMRGRIGLRSGSSQGPQDDAMAPRERFRDALAVRCQELEAARPEVLELVADVLCVGHARLSGRASALCGNRPAKYFREALRGEHAITLEDLCRLAIDAPTVVGPLLDVIAQPTGYRLVAREVAGPDSADEALARVHEAYGAYSAAVARRASEDETERAKDTCERAWAALQEARRRRSS